jgi:hypothetical protein
MKGRERNTGSGRGMGDLKKTIKNRKRHILAATHTES